jgi:hypoxanthine phosphoribosyltransferase
MNELHPDLSRIVVSTDQIQSRVKELADQISADFAGGENLYIVGILKGAFIFLADLTRQLKVPHTVDFMALSSYGKTTTSGAVRILMDLREAIEGQHVIIVEDIVDTGNTLDYLLPSAERTQTSFPAQLCAGAQAARQPECSDRLSGF